MKKYLMLVVSLGFLVFPGLGLGQDSTASEGMNLPVDNPEINNYANECVYCAAFFSQVALCFVNTPGYESLVSNYELLSYELLSRSIQLSGNETTEARFVMADQELMETMGGRCENISSILSPNLDRCTEISKDAEQGLESQP